MRGAHIFHAARVFRESLAIALAFIVGMAPHQKDRAWSGIIFRGKDAAPAGSAGFRFKYIICVEVQCSDELLRVRGC